MEESKVTSKKRILIISCIAVLVVGSGGYYAYAKRSTAASASSYLLGTAKVGDVTKTVVATGSLTNKNTVNLSFGTQGKISKLNVQVGDAVKKGQVLAQLDQSSLQTQVASSQANLRSAQAKLSQLQQGLTNADRLSLQSSITRAQADLENAKRNLDLARQNADTSYLQKQVQDASDQLSQAQSNYDTVSKGGDSVQIAMAKAQLDQANKNYSSAIAAQSNTTSAQTQVFNAENSLRSAQAAYDSAVAQLSSKQQPASEADIAQAQAQVEQAQAQLASSQSNLAQATMTAPFDGTVAAVTPHEGEQVNGNAAVMTLTSSGGNLQLIVPVDEADINLVKVGQQVTATVDSSPDKKYHATVLQVAPAGTTQNNVTTFSVTLGLTDDTSDLKIGQSMTANIEIQKKQSVITIPSEAVRGIGKRHSVEILDPTTQKPVQTQVETGLDDGREVEITSGITEGQQVVLGTKSQTTTSNNANSSKPLGGLGGSGGRGNLGGGGNSSRSR